VGHLRAELSTGCAHPKGSEGPDGLFAGYTWIVPKVRFLPADVTVEFDPEKLPYKDHGRPLSLLDVALNFDIPLEHACGGHCACTTCHVLVREGVANLSEMDEEEADRLETAAGYSLRSRLACQAVVKGDVVVEIPDWNRNYISESGGSIFLGKTEA
jgi:ferredoxin, 2Fe-2S